MHLSVKRDVWRQLFVIALIIAIVLPPCIFNESPVYGATHSNKVTFTEQLYSYYPDGSHPEYNLHGIFKGSLNDNPIFCGNHSKPSPVGEKIGDSKTMTMREYNSSEMIDKILYYGYGGPKQWSGFSDSKYYSPYKAGTAAKKREWMGISVTSMSLTRAYGGAGYWYNISGLPEFWEYIKKAAAPPNGFQSYIMYGTGQEQDLFTFIYTPEAYLTLKKTTSEKGEDSIAKAEYSVYSDSGLKNRVGVLKTKADGTTNKLTLKPGTYYVKETLAPVGWNPDAETYKVKLTEDATFTVKSVETPVRGYAKLIKGVTENEHLVSENPEEYSLAGAQYGVFKSHAAAEGNIQSQMTGVLTTGKDGTTEEVSLKPGTYYVKELVAPKGFKLDEMVHTLEVVKNETAVLNVTDIPKFDPMSIVLRKEDAQGTGMPIEGAEFKIEYYAELTEDVTGLSPLRTWILKTNSAGIVQLTDQFKVAGDEFYKTEDGAYVGLIGTYVITEVNAPKGYALMQGSIIRQVTSSGTENATVYNAPIVAEYPQTVSITLQKVDAETGEKVPQGYGSLEGAEYEVRSSSGDLKGYITTDERGRGTLAGLEPDEYTIRETKAPDGYLLNPEKITVKADIKEINTANFDYEVRTEEVPIKVEIVKYEKNGSEKIPVEGAALQVLDISGTIIEEFISQDHPTVLKGLSPGKYILREKKAPGGYIKSQDVEFEIEENTEITTVEMENRRIKIDIEKVDKESGERIEGALMELLDEKGNVIESWASTEMPHRISGIKSGLYTLHEVAAPYGYIEGEDMLLEVKETEQVQTFRFLNDHTRVDIVKVDASTGDPIPDTVFAIIPVFNEDAPARSLSVPKKTDSAGKISLECIRPGKYIIRELEANYKLGYVAGEDMMIEVEHTSQLQEFTVRNDYTKVEIEKTDIVTGDPVVGAQLSIIPLNEKGEPKTGEIYATWITTDEPHYIERIPVGDYILRENIAPFDKGYVTAEDVRFTVEETGEIQKVEMKDDYTKVDIIKVDMDTGKALETAKFELYNEENEKVAEWVSKKEPQRFEGIPVGLYTLKETKTPDGYAALASPIEIRVEDTPQVQLFEISNKKVPETGDENALANYVNAALLALVAMGIITAIVKNKTKL